MNKVNVGQREVQMIFPNYALWPHMKVMDEKEYSNLSLALKNPQMAGQRHWQQSE